MKNLEVLNEQERDMLVKFPAYITLLAANSDEGLDATSMKSAIEFSHIKTYTCDPLLRPFYQLADAAIGENIKEIDKELPKGRKEREVAIKAELEKLDSILKKLEPVYALTMHRSMKSFKDHVSKAHRNILEYFIFPLPLNGLTD